MSSPDEINQKAREMDKLSRFASSTLPTYMGIGMTATDKLMQEERERMKKMMRSSMVTGTISSLDATTLLYQEERKRIRDLMKPSLATIASSVAVSRHPIIEDAIKERENRMNTLEPILIAKPFRDPRDVRIDKIHEELADITKQLKEIKEEIRKPKKKAQKPRLKKAKFTKLEESVSKLQTEISDIGAYKADLKHLHRTNEHASDTTVD